MSDLSIAAVVGSLKASSVNRIVFDTARELMPDGVTLTEVPIADVPLFSEDVEAAGDPASVAALKDGVGAADALILFTPEYNRSIPAVTKNAIDWLSRPFFAGPIAGLPTGVVAASPGRGDAAGSRAITVTSVNGAGGTAYDETLGFSSIYDRLEDGAMTDEESRAAISAWAEGFIAFVRATLAAAVENEEGAS